MRLNQITLPVLDIPVSILFYTKLGLELIVHTHDGYARFLCPNGQATLSIQKVDTLPTGSRTTIYFEREDLDAYVKTLEAKGISFIHPPIDQPWLWREAKLLDPDNNPIKIYKAEENRINPPWRFKKPT